MSVTLAAALLVLLVARGGALASTIKGGVSYRILTNAQGSVRLVVNAATGQVAQELEYDAFGGVIKDNNPSSQPFAFGGGLFDTDTGLVHVGHREYDAVTGRWNRTLSDTLPANKVRGAETHPSRSLGKNWHGLVGSVKQIPILGVP